MNEIATGGEGSVESAATAPRWICLTPTRNEAWIVGPFLAAAKKWADDIIVADQLSDDGTRAILASTTGITPIWNDSSVFDEAHRQLLLLDRARELSGKRILIGLDADEALSANCTDSAEWSLIENAQPGTILKFRWVNVLPGFERAWIPPGTSAFGFIDDGSPHNGKRMHSPRVPQPASAPVLELNDIVVLHFQYVLWERMLSKQRWYQVLEHAKHGDKSALSIYREYHHMQGSWEESEIHPLDPRWIHSYEASGIDYRKLRSEPVTWWDKDIVRQLIDRGPEEFRKLDIWDHDWSQTATHLGIEQRIPDPRTLSEKAAHRLLAMTQDSRSSLRARLLERILRAWGW